MDSQGWVPLSVIANFKRIKSLTEDMYLLRTVCSQLKGVEFLTGENGEEDRLRSREKWNEFILDAKDRLPEARNDGPAHQPQANFKPASNGYPQFTDPYTTTGQIRSPTWNQNTFPGTSAPTMSPTSQPVLGQLEGAISETPMSAHIPEYGFDGTIPSNDLTVTNSYDNAKPSSAQDLNGFHATSLTNGHHNHGNALVPEESEDIFPNENITHLRVVFKTFDNVSTHPQPSFISNSTRTFSHGSVDEATDMRGVEISTSTTATGLRGGAGSPEQ